MLRRTALKLIGAAAALPVLAPSHSDAQTFGGIRSPFAKTGIVSALDFGAVGDGVADDTSAIQNAIDHALQFGLQTVHLPAGIYRTADTLHLGHGDAFRTIALTGDSTYSYAGTTAGTRIIPLAIDRPAINVQAARGSVIRNISIIGLNAEFLRLRLDHYKNLADADPARWLAPGLEQGIKRFAPYAAITIDAFSGAPHAEGYSHPVLPIWTRGNTLPGRGFSSDVIIERCFIAGFGVGIAVQPCDADGNGDFVKITGSHISQCVYGIAVGNSQSRNVAIRDCHYIYLHTFINTRAIGRGTGTLGGPIDNVSGNASFQFMDVRATFASPITVSHLYFEAQHRIGRWSFTASFNNPLIFQSCVFNLSEQALRASAPVLLECGQQGSVQFRSCTFNQPLRMYNLVRGASYVGLDSCNFGIIHEFRGKDEYASTPTPIIHALNYSVGGAFLHASALAGDCALSGGTIGLAIDPETRQFQSKPYGETLKAVPGKRVLIHHYARNYMDRFGQLWSIRARPRPTAIPRTHGALIKKFRYETADTLTLELVTRALAHADADIAPGDLLYDDATAIVFVVMARATSPDAIALTLKQMTGFVDIDGVLKPIHDPTSTPGTLWHYPAQQVLGDAVFSGDVTEGATTVRNIATSDGAATGLDAAIKSGDALWSGPNGVSPPTFARHTVLQSIDAGARSAILSAPALRTARVMLTPVVLV